MKTVKLTLTSLVMMALFTLNAAKATGPGKEDAKAASARCTVTLAQMITYLQGAPHYHTVYEIDYIPGTCNGLAQVAGGTSTVFVENGIIVGHTDQSG